MHHTFWTAFKIISWNVAGLRGLMNNHPDALPSLVRRYDPDVICLQETKLQESHVHDDNLKIHGHLLAKEGYDSVFNCSIKKGYSGTAIFWKKWIQPNSSLSQKTSDDTNKSTKEKKKQADIGKFFTKNKSDTQSDISQQDKADNDTTNVFQSEHTKRSHGDVPVEHLIPISIQPNMGVSEHDQEGRVLTMDFPLFSLTNVYVPNSGADLQRLSYRTDSWDPALLSFMKEKQKQRNKPVIWLGDLNVAHKNWDCWNDGAKHLLKSAGTTPEEKESFQRQLDDDHGAFVDAFRHLHPTAKGWYTYWSQRVGNREPNKGLRIDYFICSRDLMDDDGKKKVVVRDSYMVTDQKGSDHCPIVLEMEIRK
jgi:exodeoxyribonuclease III